MPDNLDDILISYTQEDFGDKLEELHTAMGGQSAFSPIDPRCDVVKNIINNVVEDEDKAVAKYTLDFDEVDLQPKEFRISAEALENAHKEIEKNRPELLKSIRGAIANVKKYQTEIFIGDKNTHPGIKYTPIERVGICVPGASAPLPSTVIMTAVPAQVAGVKEIAVVSPPRYNGSIHPVILAVCHELEITEVYRIGGAQAIAALAFGTDRIMCVDKIVGPGNQWVQTAKREVSGFVAIDSVAGPSEVLIIANDEANPAWVAADMLSQAEHNPGCAYLFTVSQKFAENVLGELKEQVVKLDRADETIECLEKYSGIAVFDTMEYLISIANEFASEHLQIQCGEESRGIADKIVNAGAIFIGDYSPVAVGDYWAGPSHTLPTGKAARFASALSSNDFIKSTSIIEYDREKLLQSADDIIRLAKAEGLDAHAKSVEIRRPKA